jgi:hypothetical protein
MADYDYDDEEILDSTDAESGEPDRNSRQFVRKLEQDAKEGKRAKKEADEAKLEAQTAKRELALMKAGIDLDSPTGKLFVKAYDGEITVEAIKAAAGEYGLIATSQTVEVANDLAAIDRVSQASTGSGGSVPTSVIDEIRNPNNTPEDIYKILQANGVGISNEQPGGWVSLV